MEINNIVAHISDNKMKCPTEMGYAPFRDFFFLKY